jgi:hypothetical protein
MEATVSVATTQRVRVLGFKGVPKDAEIQVDLSEVEHQRPLRRCAFTLTKGYLVA